MKKQRKFLKKTKKKTSGKKLCIFLMVLFTLVLVADVANLFLTPAQNQMGFPMGDFQMPEGGQMPEGDFQMPEGGDFQMPEGEMPSFGGRPGGSGQGGFLQTVRRLWLPILIVCVLGDIVCLVILLRKKALEQAHGGVSGMPLLEEEEEADSDEPPKRKRGPWTAILCMVTAFALILAMIPADDTDASSANVQTQVISGTAKAAEIQTVLSGAGTLEADNLTPVTVPQQVTVLKYHVRNGETVAAGDPLVTVDKTSASSAMMDLYDVLDDLDDDLEIQRQASNSTYIYSTAAGRVKKIYAAEGDTVTDVLYEHGALMLLSLDGTMKVTFQSDKDLTVGQEVTVKYSAISEEGRITAVREGRVTVSLSDENAWYGANATIEDEEGNTLGEGTIDINSALKVISYYGKVDGISVAVGDKVSVGSTLITLKDTGYTTDYQILLARRNALEAQMQKLSQLSQTGMLYAENDGVVSGVPEDAEIELLSSDGDAVISPLAHMGTWELVLLSGVEAADPTETSQPQEDSVMPVDDPPQTPVTTVTDKYYAAYITSIDDTTGEVKVLAYETDKTDANFDPRNYINQMITTMTVKNSGYKVGDYLVIQHTVTEKTDENGNTTVTDTKTTVVGHVPMTIDDTPVKLNGYYAAYLINASRDRLIIGMDDTKNYQDGDDLSALKMKMNYVDSFDFTFDGQPIKLVENGESKSVELGKLKSDDLLVVEFKNGKIVKIVMAQRIAQTMPDNQQVPSMGGGDFSGGGGGGDFSGGMPSSGSMTVQESYDAYIVDETELMYVSDQDEAVVNFLTDELDVLTAQVGMEAQITLDAMKGQSFSGYIARISHEGTNDGGNTKFTLTVAMDWETNMIDGMNASVKVVTQTHQAKVAIPTAALVNEDGKSFVYTTYDEETETFGGLTQVTTGASDADWVEITSGLEEGDSYFYRYAETVTYRFL